MTLLGFQPVTVTLTRELFDTFGFVANGQCRAFPYCLYRETNTVGLHLNGIQGSQHVLSK